MVKKFDVVTVGSGLVDAFVSNRFPVSRGLLSLPAGSKVRVDNIGFSVGGGGVNTAVVFSKLGLKTAFLGKVGRGYNAQIILRELKKYGVKFLGVQANEHTGYSIIVEGEDLNRTILTFKGASDTLKFSEINPAALNTKWLYFTSLADESFRSQIKLASLTKKHDIKLAFNPSSYHTRHGLSRLRPILRHTYLLSLNKEEAAMLTKSKEPWRILAKTGPSIVSITDGSKGGLVFDGRFLYSYSPKKVRAAECTGAGDAFGSSLVAGLAKSSDIELALKYAIANAESLIRVPGAHHGLLTLRELNKVLKKSKFNIKKVKV